jgi:hypothetical protein
MEVVRIEATDETPDVIFNKDTGEFRISGKSLPEDAAEFYEPLLHWFDAYGKDPLPVTHLEVHLFYYNTASSKLLLDLLCRLEEIHMKGKDNGITCKIDWMYDEDDEDMEDAGHDFDDVIELPFELIAIQR